MQYPLYDLGAEMLKCNFIVSDMSSSKKSKKGQAVTVESETAYEKA